MKAIRLHARGGRESIRFEDAPAPSAGRPGRGGVRSYRSGRRLHAEQVSRLSPRDGLPSEPEVDEGCAGLR